MKFPHYTQPDAMDCGPTCLRMIAKHYGKTYSLESLRKKCFVGREGVSMRGISDAAENIGFRTKGVKVPLKILIEDAPLPCILHWKQNHFVVLYKITGKRGSGLTSKQVNELTSETENASLPVNTSTRQQKQHVFHIADFNL